MKSVVVTGCFSPYHSGHTHLITEAMKYGKVLIVVMSDDYIRTNKHREPSAPLEERIETVARHCYPSIVIIAANSAKELLHIMNTVNCGVRVVGSDYTQDKVLIPSGDCDVVIIPRIDGLSSTELSIQ